MKLDSIRLHTSKTGKNIEIPDGLKFKNIDESDKSYYISSHDGGVCQLKRVFEDEHGNQRYEHVYISGDTAPEGVLRLYYQPENVTNAIAAKKALEITYTPSFKGVRKYYNPQYNIANAGTYQTPVENKQGNNLSIISK